MQYTLQARPSILELEREGEILSHAWFASWLESWTSLILQLYLLCRYVLVAVVDSSDYSSKSRKPKAQSQLAGLAAIQELELLLRRCCNVRSTSRCIY